MTRLILLVVMAIGPATAWCADAAPEKELNGVWAPDSALLSGKNMPKDVLKAMKLELADGKYVMTNNIGADKGEFHVDVSTDPKAMDIEGKDGPNKGRKFLCIYKLNGDELTICYDLSGKARPAEFQSKETTLHYLVVYRRHTAFPEEPLTAQKTLAELKRRRAALDATIEEQLTKAPAVEVKDYALKNCEGEEVRLSTLFGDKQYLLLVHNMGNACDICTNYATQYMAAVNEKSQLIAMSREAAFCLLSVDETRQLKAVAEKQGWKFNTVSTASSTIQKDFGFEKDKEPVPGISLLKKDGKKLFILTQRNYFDGDRILGLLEAIWLIPMKDENK